MKTFYMSHIIIVIHKAIFIYSIDWDMRYISKREYTNSVINFILYIFQLC